MSCHSGGSDAAAGLDLTSMRLILKGGNGGPALVPGQPDASLLIAAIEWRKPELKMPKLGGKLEPAEIQALRTWITDGAAWTTKP